MKMMEKTLKVSLLNKKLFIVVNFNEIPVD